MNRMFAFHGVDGKTGTTMVAQSVAETIAAADKGIKVMMVSLNGRSGTEYVDRIGESIEGLKMYLDNKVLSKKVLEESCKYTENLFLLAGVESLGQSRHYFPETAIYFLNRIEEEFDVIIADTGNDLDNGLAVGALERIPERFCILTQQESMLKRYESIEFLYRKLGIDFSCYVVNKYSDEDPYSLGYIRERLKISQKQLKKIQAVSYGRQAEMDYRTLLYYKDKIYNQDILEIANDILIKCRMNIIQEQRKKKWIPFI